MACRLSCVKAAAFAALPPLPPLPPCAQLVQPRAPPLPSRCCSSSMRLQWVPFCNLQMRSWKRSSRRTFSRLPRARIILYCWCRCPSLPPPAPSPGSTGTGTPCTSPSSTQYIWSASRRQHAGEQRHPPRARARTKAQAFPKWLFPLTKQPCSSLALPAGARLPTSATAAGC